MEAFDHLFCEIKLPLEDGTEKNFSQYGFQTSSFSGKFKYYKIDEGNQVWKEKSFDRLTGSWHWERYPQAPERIILYTWVDIEQEIYFCVWELKTAHGLVKSKKMLKCRVLGRTAESKNDS